jgi:hypothetical protein
MSFISRRQAELKPRCTPMAHWDRGIRRQEAEHVRLRLRVNFTEKHPVAWKERH